MGNDNLQQSVIAPVNAVAESRPLYQASWLIVAIALAAFVLLNQPGYPRTWFDEGWHTLAARVLAERGLYIYGPSLGPLVIVPVAIAFKAWGIGLVQARWVIAAYFALAVCLFWVLARRYGGWRMAWIALGLWVATPSVDLLWLSRNVMGEVPGVAWMTAGYLVWMGRPQGQFRRRYAALAGVCWAFAVLSKNQFFLMYIALAGVAVLDRLYYRARPLDAYLVAATASAAVVGGWYVVQLWFPYGQVLAATNVQQWTGAVSRGLLTFSVERMVENCKFLFSASNLFGLFLIGLGAVSTRAVRRTWDGYRSASLAAIVLVWLVWFTLASVGWRRYLFPASALLTILIADGIVRGRTWVAATLARHGLMRWMMVVNIALVAFLSALITRSLVRSAQQIAFSADDGPRQFAAKLPTLVEPGARIETWEPELAFLSKLNFHLPPAEVLDAGIRAQWYGDKIDPRDYNWLSSRPDYLVIGPFAEWVGLYESAAVSTCGVRSFEGWSYALYRIDLTRPGCSALVDAYSR